MKSACILVWCLLAVPAQADWLESQKQSLEKVEVQLEMLAEQGPWLPLLGPKLKLGDSGPEVARLRERLVIFGDLTEDIPGNQQFDDATASAVRHFQWRMGLTEDGVVGQQTMAALNVTPAERLQQLRATLMRMSYLKAAHEQLIVNIPAFTLIWFEGNQVRLRSRIVVGRPSRPTPMMQSEITAIELNPYWNVPYSIFRRDYLPKIRRQGFEPLIDHQIEIVEGYGKRTQVVPMPDDVPNRWPADWRLRQKAGDFNALGRLKFVLPNNNAIYLHHTNQPYLFLKSRRAFSSGCIRVEEAYSLAGQLLADHPLWHQQLLSGQQEKIVLNKPLPVALVYWTVWLDASGYLHFRSDLYGLDLGPDSQFALHKS
ncbi:L,D-transpeptidase family protein [Gallaecimonas mangrovi]|uniref:L,D-transpeptidase family protein n=1 Tax=Gallaecimonas mangrovi TaxID=2291597 RepID=UPI000E2098FE|nr:L,D-transpeptidase family protein [Gallaecimonas mangrovi]